MTCPPKFQKLAKLLKKNGIELVGCIFSFKNYFKVLPHLLDFAELAPLLFVVTMFISNVVNVHQEL